MMKAAILGTGFIAEFHAVGYAALEDVQLCAVCDIDVEKAKTLAEKFRCAWYESAEELLEKEKPDLVSICLPNFLHAQYGCLAMQSGAHVLCEKPLAMTMEECRALEETSQETGKLIMTGQVLRFWPEYTVIAKEIRRMGTPLYMQARRFQHPMREGGWRVDEKLGGGALFDLFVHDTDFVLGLMGTDAEVIAASGSRGNGGSWRRVTATFRWKNGCTATVESSSQMPPHYPFTAAFHAQYAESALDYRFCTAVNIQPGAKAETEFLLYDQGEAQLLPLSENAQEKAFKAQVAAFVEGVKSGTSPLPLHESVQVMGIVHRVREMLEAQEK